MHAGNGQACHGEHISRSHALQRRRRTAAGGALHPLTRAGTTQRATQGGNIAIGTNAASGRRGANTARRTCQAAANIGHCTHAGTTWMQHRNSHGEHLKRAVTQIQIQIQNVLCDTGHTINKLLAQWVHLTNRTAGHSRPGTIIHSSSSSSSDYLLKAVLHGHWMRVELGMILMKFAFEISVQLWSPL